MTPTAIDRAAKALRELRRTHAKLERASEARRALPPGSSRARVTTANARWATASEAHERARAAFREAAVGIVTPAAETPPMPGAPSPSKT